MQAVLPASEEVKDVKKESEPLELRARVRACQNLLLTR
jgi:hypothetical protein